MANDHDEFLRDMYKAMWDNVNRHIGVIWSSVTVLIGGFAALGLVEKEVLPVDLAVALVVVVSMWQLAHVYDASYWVNRNLFIVSKYRATVPQQRRIENHSLLLRRDPRQQNDRAFSHPICLRDRCASVDAAISLLETRNARELADR
jgi:hypothetical protein